MLKLWKISNSFGIHFQFREGEFEELAYWAAVTI
jgi:hypothetical protein